MPGPALIRVQARTNGKAPLQKAERGKKAEPNSTLNQYRMGLGYAKTQMLHTTSSPKTVGSGR